jgi:predicted transcriptional regulator
MADTATLTLDLPKEVLNGLASLAEQTGRDVAEITEAAIAAYLDLQERQRAAIAKANADGDGPWVANEDVMRWLESWETPDELPPPR